MPTPTYAATEPGDWSITYGMPPILAPVLGVTGFVVVGDSRAATFPVGNLGGSKSCPHGLPGVTIGDVQPYVDNIASYMPIKGIVTDVGVNNSFQVPTGTEETNMPADLLNLVVKLRTFCPGTPGRVLVTTPMSYEKGFGVADATIISRSASVAAVSSAMISVCTAWSIPILDINTMFKQADGTAHAGYTVDGTHYSATGRAAWISAINTKLSALGW